MFQFCMETGCSAVVESGKRGKCAAHVRKSGAAGGYDYPWKKTRQAFIAEQIRLRVPRATQCGARLPGARLTTDSECAVLNRIRSGLIADHIDPVSGKDDPRFHVLTELQFLCRECDQKKRQRESRG